MREWRAEIAACCAALRRGPCTRVAPEYASALNSVQLLPPPPSDGQAPPSELEAPPPPASLRVAWSEEPRRSPRQHSSDAVSSMAAPLTVLRRLCGLSSAQPAGLELATAGGGSEGGGEGSGPAEPPPPPWVPPASWFAAPPNASQVAVLEALEVRPIHIARECPCARKGPCRGRGASRPPPPPPAPPSPLPMP